MKKRLCAVLGLTIALLPWSGRPALAVDTYSCLIGHLAEIYGTAYVIEDKASTVSSSMQQENPVVTARLAELKTQAQDVQTSVLSVISKSGSAAALEAGLMDASVKTAVVSSTVARLNLALLPTSETAAKHVVAEMVQKLDALRQDVPADDPARGCK